MNIINQNQPLSYESQQELYGSICPAVAKDDQNTQTRSILIRAQSARSFTLVRPTSHYKARNLESKVTLRFVRPRTGRPKSAINPIKKSLKDRSVDHIKQNQAKYRTNATDNEPLFPFGLAQLNTKPKMEVNFSKLHKNIYETHVQEVYQSHSATKNLEASQKTHGASFSIGDLKKLIKKDLNTLSRSASTQQMRDIIKEADRSNRSKSRKPRMFEILGDITKNQIPNRKKKKLMFKFQELQNMELYDENDPDLDVINKIISPSQQRRNSIMNSLIVNGKPQHIKVEEAAQINQSKVVKFKKDSTSAVLPQYNSGQTQSEQEVQTMNDKDMSHMVEQRDTESQKLKTSQQQIVYSPKAAVVKLVSGNNNQINIVSNYFAKGRNIPNSQIKYHQTKKNNHNQMGYMRYKHSDYQLQTNTMSTVATATFEKSHSVKQLLSQSRLIPLNSHQQRLLQLQEQQQQQYTQQHHVIQSQQSPRSIQTDDIYASTNSNYQVNDMIALRSPITNQQSPSQGKNNLQIFKGQNGMITDIRISEAVSPIRDRISIHQAQTFESSVMRSEHTTNMSPQNQINYQHLMTQQQQLQQQQQQQVQYLEIDNMQGGAYQQYMMGFQSQMNQNAQSNINVVDEDLPKPIVYEYPINITERQQINSARDPNRRVIIHGTTHRNSYQADSFPQQKRKRPISAYLNAKSMLTMASSIGYQIYQSNDYQGPPQKMKILMKNKYIQQQINNVTGSKVLQKSGHLTNSSIIDINQMNEHSEKQRVLSEYLQRVAKLGKEFDKNFKRKPVFKVLKDYQSRTHRPGSGIYETGRNSFNDEN